MLDSACGCATHTLLSATQRYTTLELKVSYHKAMTRMTGRIEAIGEVLSCGRRAAFAQARLVDDKGTLLASATSTLLVIEMPAKAVEHTP
nr:PaaI family thioesterase [Xanthomonas citri]